MTAALSGLYRFYEGRGWHQEASEVFTDALETLAPHSVGPSPEQDATWARLHSHAALPLIRMGQIPQARALAERAAAILGHSQQEMHWPLL